MGAVGTLWINAIRMTVIPLVAALTVHSVASIGDVRRVGRLGVIALAVFVTLLVAGGAFAMVVAPQSFDRMALSPQAVENLRASVAGGAPASTAQAQVPGLVDRIVDMVPVNPVKSAVDGAVLPIVVFALLFGLALARINPARRAIVVTACGAVSDTMLVVVGWVLRAAPAGVFALGVGLGARIGFGSAGALVHYALTLSAVMLAFTLALYPVAVLLGRVSLRSFLAAALPAQAVAFSTRSSLAALPAMITGTRDVLGLPPSSTGFVLPLAVSVFRVNVPIAWVVGVLFLGKLYGVPVTEGQLAMLVVTATLLSFSVPGIPSASLLILAPVLVQNGIPAEGLGILIAVDVMPDMFKTTANVTAHLAAVTLVARADVARADGARAGEQAG